MKYLLLLIMVALFGGFVAWRLDDRPLDDRPIVKPCQPITPRLGVGTSADTLVLTNIIGNLWPWVDDPTTTPVPYQPPPEPKPDIPGRKLA